MLKPKFSIISPGWNCASYVGAWYRSLRGQKGGYDWTAYVLDDCSDDDTESRLESLEDDRVKVVRSRRSRGAAYARLKLMRMCDPSSIMVMLDLDDWLTANALQVLAQAYSDPNVLATFGSYVRDTGGGTDNSLYSPDSINDNTFFRKGKFTAPPLRTFHASLVEGVENEDMKDAAGDWYPTATDVAMTWRFLWDLRADQICHIPDILYVYRQRTDSSKRFDKARAVNALRRKYERKLAEANSQ